MKVKSFTEIDSVCSSTDDSDVVSDVKTSVTTPSLSRSIASKKLSSKSSSKAKSQLRQPTITEDFCGSGDRTPTMQALDDSIRDLQNQIDKKKQELKIRDKQLAIEKLRKELEALQVEQESSSTDHDDLASGNQATKNPRGKQHGKCQRAEPDLRQFAKLQRQADDILDEIMGRKDIPGTRQTKTCTNLFQDKGFRGDHESEVRKSRHDTISGNGGAHVGQRESDTGRKHKSSKEKKDFCQDSASEFSVSDTDSDHSVFCQK